VVVARPPLRLELSARARDDLTEIRAYIRRVDPAAATRVGQHLSTRIKRLASLPDLGAVTDRPGLRILYPTRYPYRIYYAVLDDSVRILHVRHTSREQPDIAEI
jgi:toxin ParE1/3/4